MNNAPFSLRTPIGVLLAVMLVLTLTAWSRSAEYDEQYTMFVTAGTPRPEWPDTVFPTETVRAAQTGQTGIVQIARDLRATDVHPPLYFWLAWAWRGIVGDRLFALRLLSVGLSVGSIAAVGVIAWRAGTPPALAMLLTLGCYGFAYTGSLARGFALAQFLTLAGIALGGDGPSSAERSAASPSRDADGGRRCLIALCSGALLGAATLTNYLAVFVCAAAAVIPTTPPRARLCRMIGFAAFLPMDAWFFLAQRQSRVGQFPPFELLPSLQRLARDMAANIFGGLPLYVEADMRWLVSAVLALSLAVLLVLVARQSGLAQRRIWLTLAAAPPIGLLGLGFLFNNTPIELRYLSFSVPFVALLLSGLGRASSPLTGTGTGPIGRFACLLVVLVQTLSITGLITRQETMQPARATAKAAADLAGSGIVLLPRGNDGVGIVGAFAIEAPPNLSLLLVWADESPAHIRERAAGASRIVLARMAQDAASRQAIGVLQETFTQPCWRLVAEGYNVSVHDRICETE